MADDINTLYPWYKITPKETPLSQGDLLDKVSVYFPSLEDEKGETVAEVGIYNLVIMTQSCDLLDYSDKDLVILCPRQPATEVHREKLPDKWGQLTAGRIIHQHLINKCELKGFEFDYQIINLGYVVSMELGLLKQQVQKQHDRVSMLPPYREYMAQAFARQFMRIGLPNDIPKDCPFKK